MKDTEIRQILSQSIYSDNGHLVFNFEFNENDGGKLLLTFRSTSEIKSYPFKILIEDGKPMVSIENILINMDLVTLDGVKKELYDMIYFLTNDVFNIGHK